MVQLTLATTTKITTDGKENTRMWEAERKSENEKRKTTKWDTIIPNPKSKKTPRLCFFVTCLVFLMVAAIVLVLVIKLSLSTRRNICCEDDQTTLRRRNNESKTDFKKEDFTNLEISWEMRRAFMELRQIMGEFKPTALFPLYRLDLSPHYIAYYEVKIQNTQGHSYAVISAGEMTGDYSLVETGGLPSPGDRLRDQAFLNGHYCARFYRLTTDGITACEDARLKRIVASTGDVNWQNPVTNWTKLGEQVLKALPRLKKDWKRRAKIAKRTKEWKLSGDPRKDDNTNYLRDKTIIEKGLSYGESVEIPVQNVSEVTVKFVGLSRTSTYGKPFNVSQLEWQTKLCKVLNNICDPEKTTRVRQEANTQHFAGSTYLKLGLAHDGSFVKSTLLNQEIRFRVEVTASRDQKIIMHYGIVLGERSLGRSVQPAMYEIPHEKSFPYIQYNKKCWRPGTIVAVWVMIFSYYNNLSRSRPELGYRKLEFDQDTSGTDFLTAKERQLHIAKVIASKLGIKCGYRNQRQQYLDRRKLERWFEKQQGPGARIVFMASPHQRHKAARKVIKVLKKGVPVVISTDHEFTATPSYGVVTRMRQSRSSYRNCDSIGCSSWADVELSEFFVQDGSSSGGKWKIANTYNTAAVLKRQRQPKKRRIL